MGTDSNECCHSDPMGTPFRYVGSFRSKGYLMRMNGVIQIQWVPNSDEWGHLDPMDTPYKEMGSFRSNGYPIQMNE